MQLVDARTAAPMVGLEPDTLGLQRLYRRVRLGQIPSTRIGRNLLFDPDRLKAWADSGGTALEQEGRQ